MSIEQLNGERWRGTYIIFQLAPRNGPRKTKVWTVTNDGVHLGCVGWFARWRKYAFWPAHDTAFEEVCLRELAEFVVDQTREHRAERKAS